MASDDPRDTCDVCGEPLTPTGRTMPRVKPTAEVADAGAQDLKEEYECPAGHRAWADVRDAEKER